ncbi:MAG TPA: protein kinase, partial [Gemmataceae bacterium]|nr:protein kinase [Gemmataceae bacterium]
VCQAVQHAHHKGIIHRDLKPSNVLVALYDDKPVVKVIDFGVAKATGRQLTEQTLHTGLGAVVGTVEYMSPEQASFNLVDVDTRSDVYSLGVLLYELLAGGPPFGRKELETVGLLEMLRVIREQEPSKPSIRLSTAEGLPALAANRGTEPKRLTALVRGELDWIVLKALEKDRSRRYETANGFALDVQRYLADEPVLACPPSVGYRLRKFVRRNKVALATAAVVGVAVLLAVGTIGWAFRDRDARRAEATQERLARVRTNDVKSQQALEAAQRLRREERWPEGLAVVNAARAHLADGDVSADVKRALEGCARNLVMLDKLDLIRLLEAELMDNPTGLAVLGQEYQEAFRTYGIDVEKLPPAEAGRRIRGEEIRQELLAALEDWIRLRLRPNPKDDLDTSHLLAICRAVDPDPNRQGFREAIARGDLEGMVRQTQLEEKGGLAVAALINRARILARAGQYQQAAALLRKAEHRHPANFWLHHDLGNYLTRVRPPRHAEAIGFLRTARALRPTSAGAWNNLANALCENGEREEALKAIDTALGLKNDVAFLHYTRGYILETLKKPAAAEASYREAIRLKEKYALAHLGLAQIHERQGKLDDALTGYRLALRHGSEELEEAHQGYRRVLEKSVGLEKAVYHMEDLYRQAPRSPVVRRLLAEVCQAWASELHSKGLHVPAELGFERALRLLRELAADFPRKPGYQSAVALAYWQQGQRRERSSLREAEAAYRLAVGYWDRLIAAFPNNSYYASMKGGTLHNLANVRRDQQQLVEARGLYEQALDLQRQALKARPNDGNAQQYLINHLGALGRVDLAFGDHARAARLAEELSGCIIKKEKAYADAAALLSECIACVESHKDLPSVERRVLAQQYGDQAVAWLRQGLVENRYPPAVLLQDLRRDHPWRPLRGRADFQQLLAELEGKSP